MPDAYTYISKPTSSLYSYVNPQGKETYDQDTIAYDDSNVFYDGTNPNAWTDVTKPTLPIDRSGIASGLIIPLTFPSSTMGTDWTDVNKPIT